MVITTQAWNSKLKMKNFRFFLLLVSPFRCETEPGGELLREFAGSRMPRRDTQASLSVRW